MGEKIYEDLLMFFCAKMHENEKRRKTKQSEFKQNLKRVVEFEKTKVE